MPRVTAAPGRFFLDMQNGPAGPGIDRSCTLLSSFAFMSKHPAAGGVCEFGDAGGFAVGGTIET